MVGKTTRALAVTAFLSGLAVPGMSAAQSTTPDPSWRGVDRLQILAHMTGPADAAIPSDDFCERVQRIASEGAPFPVECTSFGRAPAAEAAGDALIIVQAAVQQLDGRQVLVVAARRTASAGLEPAPIYLGATPRAVRLPETAAGESADSALREALSEILPWLARP